MYYKAIFVVRYTFRVVITHSKMRRCNIHIVKFYRMYRSDINIDFFIILRHWYLYSYYIFVCSVICDKENAFIIQAERFMKVQESSCDLGPDHGRIFQMSSDILDSCYISDVLSILVQSKLVLAAR